MVTAETIRAAFDRMGGRNTRPRRLIAAWLARLAGEARDFATDELWHYLQEEDPRIGRATVFRAVDDLVAEGVLDRVEFGDGTHRYRVCGAATERRHHHHLTCVQCRRIVEVDACLPPETLAAIASSADFALERHSLELFGRCADCRARGTVDGDKFQA